MVNTEIRLVIFSTAKDGEALYSQQKQDWEMTVAQIMNSLLENSDLNWKKYFNEEEVINSEMLGEISGGPNINIELAMGGR